VSAKPFKHGGATSESAILTWLRSSEPKDRKWAENENKVSFSDFFFQKLQRINEEFGFTAQQTFNVDESGFILQAGKHVVIEEKGVKHVNNDSGDHEVLAYDSYRDTGLK